MPKIVIAFWPVLKHTTACRVLGGDYRPKRAPQRAIRRMQREANSLGMTIRVDPIPQAA
jgi:hypothetical protein